MTPLPAAPRLTLPTDDRHRVHLSRPDTFSYTDGKAVPFCGLEALPVLRQRATGYPTAATREHVTCATCRPIANQRIKQPKDTG